MVGHNVACIGDSLGPPPSRSPRDEHYRSDEFIHFACKGSFNSLFLTSDPFCQYPDVVAYVQPPSDIMAPIVPRTTELQTSFFDVYFNVSFIRPCGQEAQLKNALVPTRIAYTAGQVEFRVECAQIRSFRLTVQLAWSLSKDNMNICLWLLLVQTFGKFGKPIPALSSVSLSKSVDPSNSTEPTMKAQQSVSLQNVGFASSIPHRSFKVLFETYKRRLGAFLPYLL